MIALFVDSNRFVRAQDGTVFSDGQFPYRRWKRYLKHFDGLVVICRMSDSLSAPSTWNLSSGPRVTFVGTPDDHGKPLRQLQTHLSRKIIRQQMKKVDAVIIRQSALGWLAAEEAERRRVPWAVEVVNDDWNAYWHYGSFLGKLYAPIAWHGSRYWIGKSRFAIYVSRTYLQRLYPCRGLSFGVSDADIQEVAVAVLEHKMARWNSEQSVCPKRPVVGMIGSLFNRYKGLHVALRALRRLKERGIRLELHVLGNGHLDVWRREAVKFGVSNILSLDGNLPSGEQVFQWLDGMDIYIQPSLTEGLPRSLIEAMSRGLPALGSRCGGILELLPEECLHRPGDDKTLSQQLERMVRNHSWRIEQARRNFHEAENYYNEYLEPLRDEFFQKFVSFVKRERNL